GFGGLAAGVLGKSRRTCARWQATARSARTPAARRRPASAGAGPWLAHLADMSQRKSAPSVRQYPEVREYMTPAPHTIAPTSSLAKAVRTMRDHQVRHLPVVDHDRVVGVLSQRDILIMESLPGVNPTEVRVDEAMVREVFTAVPETPVGEVVETMI